MTSRDSSGPKPRRAGASYAAGGAGQERAALPRPRAVPAAERLANFADDALPALLWPDPRVRLLVAGWLSGFRSPRTRRAYAGDLLIWQR